MKFLAIIAMMMSLFGSDGLLGGKPAGAFKYYEYRSTTMREYPREYYKLESSDKDGVTLSWAKSNSNITVLHVPEESVQKLDSLIDGYKLYNLKKEYHPPFMVHDGIMWHVYIQYEKGGVRCTADNAWPPEKLKEGIKAVNAYFNTLIEASKEEDIIEVKSNRDY